MCEQNITDECLAEKFKREFNEQFHILVRMHLSFVLDLNTNDYNNSSNECISDKIKLKKWNLVPLSKKSKSRGIMEGAPLTQEGICQVYQLIEFLKKEQNIKVEGIFRRTGSLARQQELRNLLNQGIALQLENSAYSIHDCASVLKGFLAELPDPLLTEAHYPAYCQIAELCGVIKNTTKEDKLLVSLQLLLLLLPVENKALLKDILNLLHLTASYESSNRMSADNLAKLFTPHLLCPRKLSPEQLHTNSQTLCGIISFMINNFNELFKIPQKLILDFRVRYEKRKLLANESIGDTANTVFTFVDQERTAKENEVNTTETALAQLYAHIQSLPESSKKRKLVKQFNKENGHGTPLQVVRSSAPKNNKSLGDSIKKHIFQKGLVRSIKKSALTQNRMSNEEVSSNLPHSRIISKARLFCTNCDSSSSDLSNTDNNKFELNNKKFKNVKTSNENLLLSVNDDDVDDNNKVSTNIDNGKITYLTSTPAFLPLNTHRSDKIFTPDDQDRKSMSPITRSTQRMTKAMQETMMTPRSRKPVLLISGTNINKLGKNEQLVIHKTMDNVIENSEELESSQNDNIVSNSLSDTFKEYLNNRSISPAIDSTFSTCTDDFNSCEFNDISNDKMSESLLFCLNGNEPNDSDSSSIDSITDNNDKENCDNGEKALVLKPTQFDENGLPTVFETSF